MIAYVYWNQEVSTYKITCINIVTLTGTLVGQAVFGFLADKKGRKTMYGIELLLLIGSTLGVVMSSEGHDGSMSVYGWLIWWRLMVGIGVGADYPVSDGEILHIKSFPVLTIAPAQCRYHSRVCQAV
jgi:MFS transporter, PHS family, inorganic phosphate transporter